MRKHKSKLIVVLAAIIIIAAAYFCFSLAENLPKSQKEEQATNKNVNSPAIDQNSNTGPNTNIAEKNTNDSIVPGSKTSILAAMPILMYHYIRNINDPNDKIGTNLSVSPEKFASELDLIKSKGYETITFKDLEANRIPEKPIILTFDDGYKDFYQSAYPELKKRGMKAVSFIITGKIGGGEYMNEAEIKEISDYGIEIGSHTLSHPDLSKLSSDKAKTEILNSKQMLENLTVKKVISLCYPSGKYTSDTEILAKTAGYEYAVTTNGGITSFKDYFALNRYRVNPDTNIGAFLK